RSRNDDWLNLRVGGLQAYPVAFAIEALQGRVGILDKSDHDVTVMRELGFFALSTKQPLWGQQNAKDKGGFRRRATGAKSVASPATAPILSLRTSSEASCRNPHSTLARPQFWRRKKRTIVITLIASVDLPNHQRGIARSKAIPEHEFPGIVAGLGA